MKGYRLRDIRLQNGMTQEQLAELSEIGAMTIHNWETAEDANPRLIQFSRVAKVLGMKPHELLKEMEA